MSNIFKNNRNILFSILFTLIYSLSYLDLKGTNNTESTSSKIYSTIIHPISLISIIWLCQAIVQKLLIT